MTSFITIFQVVATYSYLSVAMHWKSGIIYVPRKEYHHIAITLLFINYIYMDSYQFNVLKYVNTGCHQTINTILCTSIFVGF